MLLPAVVPDIPEERSDVVAARVARKLGPLFGVPWPQGPFPATWICDFSELTIGEISRGAPGLSRADSSAVDQAQIPVGGWLLHERAVVTRRIGSGRPDPLPRELAAATMNRFGPDTKAALVLTGANTLLAPVTTAVVQAWDVLHRHADVAALPVAQRTVGWTAAVLEGYRSQPALVVAAVTARAVQRLHRLPLAPVSDPVARPARCEIWGDSRTTPSPTTPVDFDLLDGTSHAVLSVAEQESAAFRDLAVRVADEWARWVPGLAAPHGSVQWHITERVAGHRRIETFAPYEPLLGEFVDEVFARLDHGTGCAVPVDRARESWPLPTVPSIDTVAALPVLTRRVVVLVLCAMLRGAFTSGSPEPFADLQSLAVLEDLERFVAGTLDRDDPVRLVVGVRVLDMRLEIVRQDLAHEASVGPTVAALVESLQTAFRRVRRGEFDPADAAELTFSANVELQVVCRIQAVTPWQKVPSASELSETVMDLWRQALRALGLDVTTVADPDQPGRPIDFHLHNYATFLGRRDDLADVLAAADLFDTVVLPSRRHHHAATGDFRPLLHSLQNATPATTRLAEVEREAGRAAAADALSLRARSMIVEAMDSDYARIMLERASVDATDEACRFALLAVPALLAVLEHHCSPDPTTDRRRCEQLLDVAERFGDRVAKGGGAYSRAGETLAARERLERYLAT